MLLDERAEQVVHIRSERVGRELDERPPREHGCRSRRRARARPAPPASADRAAPPAARGSSAAARAPSGRRLGPSSRCPGAHVRCSMSIETSCRTKSGLPAATSATRSCTPASSVRSVEQVGDEAAARRRGQRLELDSREVGARPLRSQLVEVVPRGADDENCAVLRRPKRDGRRGRETSSLPSARPRRSPPRAARQPDARSASSRPRTARRVRTARSRGRLPRSPALRSRRRRRPAREGARPRAPASPPRGSRRPLFTISRTRPERDPSPVGEAAAAKDARIRCRRDSEAPRAVASSPPPRRRARSRRGRSVAVATASSSASSRPSSASRPTIGTADTTRPTLGSFDARAAGTPATRSALALQLERLDLLDVDRSRGRAGTSARRAAPRARARPARAEPRR